MDLKFNNLNLSGITMEFKTLPTLLRSHRSLRYNTFAMESVKIGCFKTFWSRIFARDTLLLLRCFSAHARFIEILQ